MPSKKELKLLGAFVVCIFLIILIYISCFYPPNYIISNFVSRLPIATHFFIGMGIVLTFWIFQNNYEKNINDTSFAVTERSFINIYKLMSNNYKICPDFIDSLEYTYGKNHNEELHNNIPNKYMKDDKQARSTKIYISICIFQAIEDYITSASLTHISDAEWFCTFYSLLYSTQLQQMWEKLKINFGQKTFAYINLVIGIAKKTTFATSEEAIAFSKTFIKSKEFLDIVKMIDETNVTQL
jgi:hypothetical protein